MTEHELVPSGTCPAEKGTFLEQTTKPFDLAYFLVSGVGSTVAFSRSVHRIEVGLSGREGMSGSAIFLQGEQSSNETFMQVDG